MCVLCGDTPTWRYHFANGQRFTSSMRRDFAEAQANAHGVEIVSVEEFVSGEWRSTPAHSGDGSVQK